MFPSWHILLEGPASPRPSCRTCWHPFPPCLKQGLLCAIGIEGNIVGGTIGEDALSFHRCFHKLECQMALIQGYLV